MECDVTECKKSTCNPRKQTNLHVSTASYCQCTATNCCTHHSSTYKKDQE